MKENVMMRIASVLLIAVLLTTSAVSGTYAKYVTADDASDSARVAKWGVTVTGTSDSMFKKTYAKDDSTTAITNTVESSEYVIAPGTKGQLTNFSVTGNPEVAVRVTYDVTAFDLDKWFLDANKNGTQDLGEKDYCPLVITINSVPYYINGVDIKTVEELENTVISVIENTTKDYEVGDALSNINTDLQISWTWAYQGGVGQTDDNDTALGNQAAAGNAATINLTVTCIVTQID